MTKDKDKIENRKGNRENKWNQRVVLRKAKKKKKKWQNYIAQWTKKKGEDSNY